VHINDIPDSREVFIDANIFIYHFASISEQCTHLFERIRDGELTGFVNTIILAEVLHRRMIAEALEKGLVTPKNAVRRLKERSDFVKTLTQYSQDVQNIIQTPLIVKSVTKADILTSASIRCSHGVLTNDSIILATMERLSILDFVTHDNDFDGISKLKLWKPDDI
jgi:predicted nucleic acid-binding protein